MKNDYFAGFKQSARRDLCLGDVTAAVSLRLQADTDIIEKLRFSVGGVSMTSLQCIVEVEKVIGRLLVVLYSLLFVIIFCKNYYESFLS